MKRINKIFITIALGLTIFFFNFLSVSAANSHYYKDYGTEPVGVTVSYYTDIYSRGFAWTTMEDSMDSTVQYLEAISEDRTNLDWSQAQSVTGTKKVIDKTYYMHKAVVYDLEPGKNYYYRVGSVTYNTWSDVGLIKVDDNPFDEFTFLFTTDSQQDSISGFQYFANLVKIAYETHPEAAFMLNGGDITNNNYDANHNLDEWLWAMELPKIELMDSVFMPVSGNHDAYGTLFADKYALNYQGSTTGGGYLSFDYGDVHFVLLNTNEYFNPENAQVKWLEEDLKNTDKCWKIILLHKGLVSTGDHSNDSDVQAIREVLFPIMAKYEVDLVLQGHDHVYFRSRPYLYGKNAVGNYFSGKNPNFDEVTVTEFKGNEEIVYTVEPNGTVYVTGNYAGSKSYPPINYDQSLIFPSINPFTGKANSAQIQEQMFIAITIDGNELIYKAYTYDGANKVTLYDQYGIRKNTHLKLASILEELPEIEDSTIFDIEKIAEAINEYNNLTLPGKKRLADEKMAKIEAYIEKYEIDKALRAKTVAVQISEIGAIEKTEEFRVKLQNAKRNYLALTEDERKYVENYALLVEVENEFFNNLKADAVSEMIELYHQGDKRISAEAIRNAYDLLSEEQKALVKNADLIPEVTKGGNLWIVLISVGILLVGVATMVFIKFSKKLKNKSLLSLSLVLLIIVSILASSPLQVKANSGNEVLSPEWEISETAIDLMVEDTEPGGVGYISYRNVPYETGDERIRNSIVIPVENYDVANEVVSIKYRTNIDTSGKNITLFALVKDLNLETNEIEVNRVLFGWFQNWNVISGKTEDGYDLITADHKHYTKAGTVVGLVINFGFVPSSGFLAYMSFLGIDFHKKSEKPVFATDPKPASVDEPTVIGDGYNLTSYNDGWKVDVSADANGSVNFNVQNWNSKVADTIQMDIIPTAGQEIEVYGNNTLLLKRKFETNDKVLLDAPVEGIIVLRSIKLVIKGEGSLIIQNLSLTKKPAIANYATTNTSYFTKIEEVKDQELLKAGYDIHVIRNDNAGYPKFTMKIDNYRKEYDVICVNIKTVSGITLLGLNINRDVYIIDHYREENFMEANKEFQYTFFYPFTYDENWNEEFTMYVNPNSLSKSGYNYASEFYFGITFMKSTDLKTPEFSLEKDSYEKEYDGNPVNVAVNVETEGLESNVVYYDALNNVVGSAPVNSGTYKAVVTIEGNREYKQMNIEVPIIINALTQELPDLNEIIFDSSELTISFPNNYEVNLDPTFNPETSISSGINLEPGTTLYIRRMADLNHLPSEAITFKVPEKTAAPKLEVESVEVNKIVVKEIEGAEYRIIGEKASEWTENNEFTELEPNTTYRIEARIKGTEEVLESEISFIEVTTLEALEKSQGCKSVIKISSIMMFILSLLSVWILRKYKKNG